MRIIFNTDHLMHKSATILEFNKINRVIVYKMDDTSTIPYPCHKLDIDELLQLKKAVDEELMEINNSRTDFEIPASTE